ncbi:HEPN domain-containing protein [Luteolibacter sp. LG18]|uniref:HEPN domain-containing protein n=1 Tax=Luteolibacter sp. LG18 TaxID=2819286 RepID=UPI002B2D416B|nr:hypothetical protein llg_14600 [Luteolibacter sp. LG18]
MPYTDHFRLTDDLIAHLDTVVAAIRDPFIQSRYTGFIAVSAVTVLELSIKTIFNDFSAKKHKVLGCFCASFFDRINGKIGLKTIREDYLAKFGDKYVIRFKKKIEKLERANLASRRVSFISSYGNLITWRNEFAHAGRLPTNASYAEVKKAYLCGKEIMACLDQSLRY